MQHTIPLSRVIDLTDPAGNRIYNMTIEEARALVASGDSGDRDADRRRIRSGGSKWAERQFGAHDRSLTSLLHRQVARWTDAHRR